VTLSTVCPDVVSSLEAKVETEPLESENHVERTTIEPGAIVGEETEGRVEIEPSHGVTDVAVLEQVTCASLIFDRNILLMRVQSILLLKPASWIRRHHFYSFHC
jgi:hypothetical protein